MNTNRHEFLPGIKNAAFDTDSLHPRRSQTAATTHFGHRFNSPSVPRLPFLRWVARVALPRAPLVQAARA